MNYAILLCGGVGKRVLNSNIPKQFIEINNKPIIIHTLEKFLFNINIDKIIVSCHSNWIDFLKSCIRKYLKNVSKNIYIVSGGDSRNQSIKNGLYFIINELKAKPNDVVLTHDGVRMFVTNKVIDENIEVASKKDVVTDTCIKSIDTMVISRNDNIIDDIPNRNYYFNGQTPQSSKLKLMKFIYSKKYDANLFNSTDLCKLALENKLKIIRIEGDYFNFKITTDFDLNLAKVILEMYE